MHYQPWKLDFPGRRSTYGETFIMSNKYVNPRGFD